MLQLFLLLHAARCAEGATIHSGDKGLLGCWVCCTVVALLWLSQVITLHVESLYKSSFAPFGQNLTAVPSVPRAWTIWNWMA
ncbi:hypothetical protein ACQKWADRAFT_281647 [Trichoderma austrokoningii]